MVDQHTGGHYFSTCPLALLYNGSLDLAGCWVDAGPTLGGEELARDTRIPEINVLLFALPSHATEGENKATRPPLLTKCVPQHREPRSHKTK